jgi:hypothetical protein
VAVPPVEAPFSADQLKLPTELVVPVPAPAAALPLTSYANGVVGVAPTAAKGVTANGGGSAGDHPPLTFFMHDILGGGSRPSRTLVVMSLAINKNLTCHIPSNTSFSLPMLQIISLYDNKFEGPIPLGLAACQHLQQLSLGRNLLVDVVPVWLAKLPQLTMISIGGNKIVGPIPAALSNLSMLNELDISFSNLSQEVPVELGKLVQLTYLHLSFNQLTGPFPEFLGNLSRMAHISLRSNQLTGLVPSTLGNNRPLMYLDIRDNHLHGDLSFLASLCSCSQLQVLGISGVFPAILVTSRLA